MVDLTSTANSRSLEYVNGYRPSSQFTLNGRIANFFKIIYPTEPITIHNMGVYADRYFGEAHDHKRDVERFFASINQTPPLSQRNCLSTVRILLEENNIELPMVFWRRLKRRITGNSPLTQDEIPTNVQLRQILMNMPISGRALFSTLASSGARIGEVMRLKDSDIDLDAAPAKITIPAMLTKTKTARITFISKETKGFIMEYKRINGSGMLFPFSMKTAQSMWGTALSQTKMDQKDSTTSRLLLHPHSLRKYFRTIGGKINRDATEVLMGHKGNPNDPAYRKLSQEDLIAFYKRLEPLITVFSDQVVVDTEVDRVTKSYEAKIAELEGQMTFIENQFEDMMDFMKEQGVNFLKDFKQE